jgi:phosphopantothenoylcysteine decarboxylase / phosphopantothenate---cysteine ligase
MRDKRILLIVGGGIAAYKSCELVRLIRKAGGGVRCVLTAGGAQFVTPMTLAALSEQPVHTSLWDLKDEVEMGHIQLSREADLIVVCPATADLLAKMAAGIADDLATTLLLATDKKVLAAPAMNVRMWQHEATRRNVARLRADGVAILDPDEGEMACGEYGPGRLPEPEAILAAIEAALGGPGPLFGRHVIVTAGPTHEPIDPVALDTPAGVSRINVETARQMDDAVKAALPADAAVLVAAVADWRVEPAPAKLKKADGPPRLDWQANPDILAGLDADPRRPRLLIGFAAETDDVEAQAADKRSRKGCDWILANDVSGEVMGGDSNRIHLVDEKGAEDWEMTSKAEVGRRLAQRIADALA